MPLLAVVGPTGTGKSDLAIALARYLTESGRPSEIINIDSMQFYKGMDIGTAKLPESERGGVPHHLFDFLEITEESTAANYQELARPLIERLQARGVIPILVGGSMLYIAAVLNDFNFPGTDAELRAQLALRRQLTVSERTARLDHLLREEISGIIATNATAFLRDRKSVV